MLFATQKTRSIWLKKSYVDFASSQYGSNALKNTFQHIYTLAMYVSVFTIKPILLWHSFKNKKKQID